MSSILGHSHPEICEVVTDQMGRLDHLLSTFISEPVADLADIITSNMPDPLDKVCICTQIEGKNLELIVN